MSQAFAITLGEGFEAFLIVALSVAYLRRTGRQFLVPAVYWGIAVAVPMSAALAMLFQRASNQALWEGLLTSGGAALSILFTTDVRHTVKQMGHEFTDTSGGLRSGFSLAFVGV